MRMLSLRAFDTEHLMLDAELVDGEAIETPIARFFADPRVAYVRAHFAKRGRYAARIERAAEASRSLNVGSEERSDAGRDGHGERAPKRHPHGGR